MNPSVRSALGVLHLMCVFHDKSLLIVSQMYYSIPVIVRFSTNHGNQYV